MRTVPSLVNKITGKFTPFRYGWITVPTWVEIYVARKFNIQPFLWDRPPDASDKNVQAILFEWVDGKMLSQVQINSGIANRAALNGLHQASIAHGDIRAENILVNDSRVLPRSFPELKRCPVTLSSG